MSQTTIQNLLDLIQPDDKIILINNGQPVAVILGLDKYQKMLSPNNPDLDLTRSELLDRINREIALLNSIQEEETLEDLELELGQNLSRQEKYYSEITSQEIYYPEPLE